MIWIVLSLRICWLSKLCKQFTSCLSPPAFGAQSYSYLHSRSQLGLLQPSGFTRFETYHGYGEFKLSSLGGRSFIEGFGRQSCGFYCWRRS
ncbi:hypothetical protein L873DRAFT_1481154 [Choiromyces venosus 120613-1]|uniref:Secreted protein n=1 Tax=Choiromyces venosus 120613-1 TaxID=1336337 RepID=A0A3N4J9V1_9PEZI|nr:hypothetical protein L873DRAFT_1481154 [Choiromyces venosus 120613-1]